MKKALLGSLLALLCTGIAVAGEPAPTLLQTAQTPQPAIAGESCQASSPLSLVAEPAPAPPAIDLFTPAPQPAAICPLIGCVDDDYCSRDRDCTARPGGTCSLFCPKLGCCHYPA